MRQLLIEDYASGIPNILLTPKPNRPAPSPLLIKVTFALTNPRNSSKKKKGVSK